jgi:hypothetical protein
MRIFWGLVAMALGAVIIIKTEWLLNNIGRMDFFESKLSTMGGSRFGYKLLGLIVILVGIAMVTNLVEGFAEWLASFFIAPEYHDNLRYN